jgi:hypothetical protein
MSEGKCLKCEGPLVRGFVASKSQGTTHYVTKWVAGSPENVEVVGIRSENVKVHDRWNFQVDALRCDQCGFLELYAV